MAQEAQKPGTRNRYRKIEVRMWGDLRFTNLSAIPPCGQGLWIFLLTGPHTGPIPGLFRSGRAAMAEELNWELEAFDKAFEEAFQQGMVKADWKAKVVWIPNAISCNKPESPNVIRSWATEWDLIPECDLKNEAYKALRANIHAVGEAYAKAFDETFGKTIVKSSLKTMPNQEQEQEQDNKEPPLPPKGKKSESKTSAIALKTYLQECKTISCKPIPDDDSVFDYAQEAGIPSDFLWLQWKEFIDRYCMPDAKRYKNWRSVFKKSVRGNWFKLWYVDSNSQYVLTTVGVQAQKTHKGKAA